MRNVLAALVALLVALPAAAQTIPQHHGGFTLTGGTATCGTPAPGNAMVYTVGDASTAIDIAAGLVGTITFQASYDTAIFFNVMAYPIGGGAPAATTTTSGRWTIPVFAYRVVCATITAYTSGSTNVTVTSSTAPLVAAQSMATTANMGVAVPGPNALLTAMVPNKSVVHQPAAATAAVASVGSGGAGVSHVATGCTVSISTVAAQPDIIVNLTDGTSGTGAILWTCRLTCAISTPCICQSGPLRILGGATNGVSCVTATAPAAGNFATASLTYYNTQ